MTDEMERSWLTLSLHDARSNCRSNRDARVTITLKSGVQFTGRLDEEVQDTTVMLNQDGGGWVTMLTSEIAAVRSHWR